MPSPADRRYLTYRDVYRCVDDIVKAMVPSAKFEHIIAIGRGGLIPAALIAYRFGLLTGRTPEIEVIYASSYKEEERGTLSIRWPHNNRILDINHIGRAVLIVDDITDSGATMSAFVGMFPLARTAVIVHKEGSAFIPDYYGRIDSKNEWYVFPWERGTQPSRLPVGPGSR